MNWPPYLIALVICFGTAFLTGWLAVERGRSFYTGFLLGMFFGPLGLMAVGFAPVIEHKELQPLVPRRFANLETVNKRPEKWPEFDDPKDPV
jgi:hypothetical protein